VNPHILLVNGVGCQSPFTNNRLVWQKITRHFSLVARMGVYQQVDSYMYQEMT
jgi:hypothetical protein